MNFYNTDISKSFSVSNRSKNDYECLAVKFLSFYTSSYLTQLKLTRKYQSLETKCKN